MLMASKVEPRSTKNGSSTWPAKTLPPPGSALDRLVGDRVVVGERLGPDVVRRRGQALGQQLVAHLMAALVALAPDRVGLHEVELRVVDRADARQRVEERVRVADLGLELEPVADVVLAVAGVVDVEVVRRPIVEAVEVRAAGRILERDPVADQGHRPWSVGGHEGVDVGVVRRRVERRQWRFAVARSRAGSNREHACRKRRQQRHRQDRELAHEAAPPWEVVGRHDLL